MQRKESGEWESEGEGWFWEEQSHIGEFRKCVLRLMTWKSLRLFFCSCGFFLRSHHIERHMDKRIWSILFQLWYQMDISSFLKLFTKGQKMELTWGKKLIILFILNENVWFLFHWCKCKKGYVNSLILWEIQTILCSFSYKHSQTPSLILILILESFPKDVWNVITCEIILVSQQIYKFLVTIFHIIPFTYIITFIFPIIHLTTGVY